jgi:hypothetical protein
MKVRAILLAVAFAGLTCTQLSADLVTGSFNIAGTIEATHSAINWQDNSSPFTAMEATIGPGATGSFAGLDGTTVTIEDLNSSAEPVGSLFGPDLFISFNADPSLTPLAIDMIYAGFYGTSECTIAAAPGQQCTPNNVSSSGVSPFNFVNNPPPPGQATATFAFSGTEGTSNWTGNFTSQFTVPYQTVLAELASHGSVSNTYSASFDVVATPEPNMFPVLGLGLAMLLLVARSNGLIARLRRRE